MKRIIMMLALAAFLVAALSVSALSAFAAPITCKNGQFQVTNDRGDFSCKNPGGKNVQALEETKNPND